ncbi:MAG: deoxyribodipyrimidine photo-lyase [Acidobacteriota bacterium]|nr:DNA photolyase family protein [Blastocatellia bacterium]MDW8412715.1 deoxyribodipyrimidine photo-lyase [Acidobacteriota bacterium]
MTAIVWFRLDLRLDDNPALAAAAAYEDVVPIFIWSPEEEGTWAPGAASRWWLHQSLVSLDQHLKKLGISLIVRRGKALEELLEVVKETGAQAVFWNRRYEPAIIERDKTVKSALLELGLRVETFNGSLLYEPWEVSTTSGQPFQVFTPFWKACLKLRDTVTTVEAPKMLSNRHKLCSLSLKELNLEPTIDWTEGIRSSWTPGIDGAVARLRAFINKVASYALDRDRPDLDATSSLSPHLHFGEISVRRVFQAVTATDWPRKGSGQEVYLKELGWREFAYHLLYHFPYTIHRPLRQEFESFPWKQNAVLFKAWCRGKTGYPLVDAGMRQLWRTGWMHNRVRMIVASFLVKDLLIGWQEGAKWFWDTLVDADLASNTLGWQWTAGCGADAAPYFRIFNPILQGEKFDPEGKYVRRWVPELARLPNEFIHRPWEAPAEVLAAASVKLGHDYPYPIVDHFAARERALAALAEIGISARQR